MPTKPCSSKSLRVGSVPYLVGRPLDHGLGDEPGISMEYAVPAHLIEKLRAGDLDVALVSSIELFRQPGYRYIPGVAVAGRGQVSSVQVFLRKPMPKVRTLALDPASRTAATLVRVLTHGRRGGALEFVDVPEGEDPRQAGCDAWLRIGDQALLEYFEPGGPKVFNPSRAWAEREGLPFIFATWIVRPGVEIEPHLAAFARARLAGSRRIDQLAAQAASDWKLPLKAVCTYFFDELEYEPQEEMQRSLHAFRDAAAALGLCRGDLAAQPLEAFLAHRP
jgi:chorismate dehydratase